MANNDDKPNLTFTSPIGTASFVKIWEAKSFQKDKEPQFGLILCFPTPEEVASMPEKDRKLFNDSMSQMKQAIKTAAVTRFGADYKAKGIKLKNPIRPASDYKKYGAPFDVEGRTFINVHSNTQPDVIDRNKNPITRQRQTDFYPGCLARVTAYAHAFDTSGNKGVTLLLNNVQKAGEGERLAGGRKDAAEDFDRLDDDGGDNYDDIL